jgi:hypothetical protein
MHDALRAVFEKHESATADHKRDAHAQLVPVARMVARGLAHVAELQAQLMEAELAVHDHGLDTKHEWMHNRLRVVKSAGEDLQSKVREFARSLAQLEEIFDQDKRDIIAYAQGNAAAPAPAEAKP